MWNKKKSIFYLIGLVMTTLLITSTIGISITTSNATQINPGQLNKRNIVSEYFLVKTQIVDIPLMPACNSRENTFDSQNGRSPSWQLYTVNQISAKRGTGVALDNQKRPHIFYYTSQSLIHSYWDGDVWQHETVAPASIYHNGAPSAFIDSSGIIHVFYFDTQQNLGYAWFDDEWTLETIDSGGTVGDYNSISFDSSNTPHVIYDVAGSSSPRYATKTNNQWQISILPGTSSGYVSIVLDSQEHPHMFYHGNYYYYDGSTWHHETVSGISTSSSMTLDFDDQPHISYYWIEGSSYDLRYAYKNNGVWQYYIIDPGYQQSKRGWYNHIDIDQNGVLHISYLDHNLCQLKHAWGFGNSWNVEIVEQLGNYPIWNTGNDIVIDGNNIYFSYYNELTQIMCLATFAGDFAAPENLTAEIINATNVFLSWDHPGLLSLVMPTEYRIYQNDIMIAEINADTSEYLVEELGQGYYVFHVTAVFNHQNESLPSNQVIVVIGDLKENLSCSGSLNWANIKPGATVSGEFTIENIGDSGSLLNWEIHSHPDWGNWAFTPNNGFGLKPEDGEVTVSVEVIAPKDKKTEFTGEIILVNSDDPNNSCIIPVSLTTPIGYHSLFRLFFQRLLQCFSVYGSVFKII
ncbi:MAG: hypothetical protein R6V50_07970 [Thermoplasmatota archaeon]